MNLIKLQRNLLFVLIIIYLMQGSFYRSGSILSQGVLLVYLIFGLCHAVYFAFKNYSSPFGKILLAFWILNGIYFILNPSVNFYGENASIAMFKCTSAALLSFFPFYFFSRKGLLTTKSLMVFYCIAFVVSIFSYYQNLSNQIKLGSADEATNNMGYLFVMLLPLLCIFWNKRLIMYSFLGISVLLVMEGAKRGAIVCLALGLIILMYFLFKEGKNIKRIVNIALATMALFILFYIGYQSYLANEYLQQRMVQTMVGNSSGRDVIYSKLFDLWVHKSTVLQFLFGYGYCGAVDVYGQYAHNDWLEIVMNCGLLGGLIYLAFFFKFFQYVRYQNLPIQLKCMLVLCFSIWASISLFSMAYTSLNMWFVLICLGYVIGQIDSEKSLER